VRKKFAYKGKVETHINMTPLLGDRRLDAPLGFSDPPSKTMFSSRFPVPLLLLVFLLGVL
jgi:hypothetical protein